MINLHIRCYPTSPIYKCNKEVISFVKHRILNTYDLNLLEDIYPQILRTLSSSPTLQNYNIEIIKGLIAAIHEHKIRELFDMYKREIYSARF